MDTIKQHAKEKMEKSLHAFQANLSKVRTGRANPELLDPIKVDCYGSEMPINQVATISVSDATTLMVSSWDKSLVPKVEKAIINADLGLNPVTAGDVIRVPLPPLTEERRKELTKHVRGEGEQAKVAIRNIRREAISQFKEMVKDKSLSEDDARRGEEGIQKLTDEYIASIDAHLEKKEAELMKV